MKLNTCSNCGFVHNKSDRRCHVCGAVIPTEDELELLSSALALLEESRFDEAKTAFEDVILQYPDNAQAYWGRLRARYHISYRTDAFGNSFLMCPTRSGANILEDCDYIQAMAHANDKEKSYMQEQAERIKNACTPSGLSKNRIDRFTFGEVNPNDAFVREEKEKRQEKSKKKIKKWVVSVSVACILIIAAIVFLTKSQMQWISNNKNTTDSQTDDPNKGNQPLPWNNAYVPEQHANTNKNVGDLILVNAQNAYALTDTISSKLTNLYGYEGHGSYYVLPSSNTKIRSSIIQAMTQLIFDMVDANDTLRTSSEFDRLYITAAYRDTATQESLNSTNPNRYPELPGYSEHHTGLAFDLKVMTKETTISLRDNEYEWLEANCAKYGFVIRYDVSKSALTGIAYEPYHLRYVGIPHATYMTEHDLCLEEYLELLRNSHKYDQTPLEFKAGEQEYLVYYVAANTAEGATFTSIPVPPATEGTYTISGDNMNGFIVTVTKAAK